ncbi:hypothetical protein PGT21_021805 [Puccinia graminis f. sp. tritici]|uniref:Uncharacterized protein n=1 Tax=Puccinia graminis f. sp. tritici TaxID=56615 RepID=A0A5B0N4Q9_PUCGR|nr:hypothetical protein PGT21_021805 [Puccinia graminis f. sp. tritici]
MLLCPLEQILLKAGFGPMILIFFQLFVKRMKIELTWMYISKNSRMIIWNTETNLQNGQEDSFFTDSHLKIKNQGKSTVGGPLFLAACFGFYSFKAQTLSHKTW